MSWLQQLGGLLQQYTGASPAAAPQTVQQDYHQMAQAAPQELLAHGIASAFRSDQTPPFPQMVSQMFGQASPDQRAGLLNTLAGAVGPGVLQQVLGGFGGGQVSPQVAAQVPPQAVEQMAAHAERQSPSVIDQVGGFFSQHPGLLATLGTGALTAAMSGMAQRHQSGVAPASQDPYGDPGAVSPASQDPFGDPGNVAPASQDPYGDPADQPLAGVSPASQDPYGDPAGR